MQENEELPAELVDLYGVLFISQTLEDLLAEKMLEDNDYDSDGDNTELKGFFIWILTRVAGETGETGGEIN
ncbi:hypothetical protein F8M41_025800 [Gigaspora margarita]|uniref:Uncharacterized protein n=1 Tax=Gigaspora margarita TaxID=4874 RepID=A0A8H4AZV6_GIGMA|nr:hypothetical protein F8M41_025800 [Gigaspora margarita]